MKISNIYILLLAAFVIVACDPLKDINKEIEEDFAFINDISYTLTEDDYEDMGQSFPNFSSDDDAKSLIPGFLSDKFPALGKGSSALITYDLYRGSAPGLWDYTSADEYVVSEADYTSVDADAGAAGFFNNSFTSGEYIPGILAANIASPSDGDLVAVNYEYASIEYADISGVEIYLEDFEGLADLSGHNTISESGAEVWELYESSSPYFAARMNGYNSGNQPNVDWLILPEIDLTGFSAAKLKLTHATAFMGSAVAGTDLAVMISTDYDGVDPSIATWNNLTLDQWSTSNYEIVDAEASLASYSDQQIYIAFYFKSTVDYAPQWRLVNILVDEGEQISTNSKNNFYEYTASTTSWSAVGDEVYFLSSDDYDAMGDPGAFNNFSSSTPASNYLPAFLGTNVPYAQEEESYFIIYKYYSSSSGLGTRGDFYTLTNGNWESYASVTTKVFSFGHEGNDTWVPDNTIKHTMTGSDYAFVSAAYADSNSAGSASMATYGNYDFSLWTPDQIQESVISLATDIFSPGVEGQKYLITYATWEPGASTGTVHVIFEGGAYILFVK